MSNGASTQYDVVIIGAGVSGNLIAKQLGLAGKKVFILEAGLAVPDSREEYVNNFYLALAKTPESPYPALAGRTGSEKEPVGKLPHPAELPTPRATVLSIGKGPDHSYLIQAQPWIETHDPKLPPQNPPPKPSLVFHVSPRLKGSTCFLTTPNWVVLVQFVPMQPLFTPEYW